MREPMTEAKARERLARCQQEAITRWRSVDAILATTDALAVLLDPAELLKRWAASGRVQVHLGWTTGIEEVDTDDDGTVTIFPAEDLDTKGHVARHIDWGAIGKIANAEQLTALLRGAEEAGRAYDASSTVKNRAWGLWRIVPDEEGAT